MVSTNLGSRSEIKRHLKSVFSLIEKKDYSGAKEASDSLQWSIQKYYSSRGKDCSVFYELFDRLNFTIEVHTNCDSKTDALLVKMEDIMNQLRESTSDPIESIKEIHDEILNLYLNINAENANNLLDVFDDLKKLRPKMKELGGPGWVYYCSALQQLSVCESAMMRVIKAEKIPGTLLAEIECKFSDLFTALYGVIVPASLDEKQIKNAYVKGVPLEEISYGTGETVVDLQKMLQDEELHEEETN
jgi:hypothetical protein